VVATPPKDINITLPPLVRSGAPMSVSVLLTDGFGQLLNEWENLVVTITTDALLSGSSLRVFYADGAAVFPSLSLKGNESTAYELMFTMSGPDLFGNDVEERSMPLLVTVQPCEPGERFDADAMDCACATGWGLVTTDHTCRKCADHEVVPTGGLSCVSCSALSARSNISECECIPGYFGTIVGAVGACTQCPADMFRSAADPPFECRACPPTSHTFALGATSEKDCLCAINTFNDLSATNASFACAAVPEGGWAPQADSRLFALEGYWRPNKNFSHFYKCAGGMCLREEPLNGTQLGYKCRVGHTGHVCAVCEQGWSFSGKYCHHCDPSHRFDNWSTAQKAGVLFFAVFWLVTIVFLLFLLPLFPNVEAALEAALQPAVESMERALGTMTGGGSSRPGSRPASAGSRPASRGPATHIVGVHADQATSPTVARMSRDAAAARRSSRTTGVRRRSVSITIAMEDGLALQAGGDIDENGTVVGSPRPQQHEAAQQQTFALAVERPSRVRVFFDVVGEPVRVVVSFWQVVSSFSGNLYVPWPSLYYALANSLNVVSLQFLKASKRSTRARENAHMRAPFRGTNTRPRPRIPAAARHLVRSA
jgi:hypothetical protein